jgi:hypothetical protein
VCKAAAYSAAGANAPSTAAAAAYSSLIWFQYEALCAEEKAADIYNDIHEGCAQNPGLAMHFRSAVCCNADTDSRGPVAPGELGAPSSPATRIVDGCAVLAVD